MKPRLSLLAPVAALVLNGLAATPAQACTLCSCSTAATDINFGTYNPLSASAKTSNTTVTINCTGLVSLLGSVDIGVSSGASGILQDRKMMKGTSALHYNLYTDAGLTALAGNGSGGSNLISRLLTGLLAFSTSATIYGKLPAQQWVAPGTYTDSVIITITY